MLLFLAPKLIELSARWITPKKHFDFLLTISRVVRNSDEFGASAKNQLVVINQPNPNSDSSKPNPAIRDCLGEPIDPESVVTNTFTFDDNNGQLLCNTGGENEVLADGLAIVEFRYGEFGENDGRWISNDDYDDPDDNSDDPGSVNNIISVRVKLKTKTGLETIFTATSRHRAIHGEGEITLPNP
ncbi:MAG: hypothetical protein MZV65_01460 [Chromatiales bacterium]|nr:hypothetical protein [Chromatiales bacterium]